MADSLQVTGVFELVTKDALLVYCHIFHLNRIRINSGVELMKLTFLCTDFQFYKYCVLNVNFG